MKTWLDLSAEERENFAEEFYTIWESEFDFGRDDDGDNPSPWGMPWTWSTGDENDPAIPAEEFFSRYRSEIENCQKN